jgi:threonine/homoserine/homoserine lactone efflux protein
MDLGWIAAVSGFALAMAGTPGPNNTLVTVSGANYGFRRTLPLMSGIAIGVVAIIAVVGAVGSPLVADPRVGIGLKWAGFVYLLWLAWRIGNARPTMNDAVRIGDGGGKPLTLVQGASFQLVNPKLWAMVAGAVVTYGSTAETESPFAIAVAFGVIFGVATLASTAVWTLIGIGAGRFIKTGRAMRVFNWTMASLLVLSLIPIVAG